MEGVADVLKGEGHLMAIVRDGEGIIESWREVVGRKLRRVVYLYSREDLITAARRFEFVREGRLASELIEDGWRSYIFRVRRSGDTDGSVCRRREVGTQQVTGVS